MTFLNLLLMTTYSFNLGFDNSIVFTVFRAVTDMQSKITLIHVHAL